VSLTTYQNQDWSWIRYCQYLSAINL